MKGTLKSYVSIWKHLASHSVFVCDADLKTFQKRVLSEGLQFLTTTLPALGKDLDRSLATGSFVCTSRFAVRNKVPIFLGKLFNKIFIDGQLIDSVETAAYIKSVRQLTMLFYKLEGGASDELGRTAVAQFIRVDRKITPISDTTFLKNARRLVRRLLCNSNPLDITPRHGPGATSCRTKNQDKWHSFRYIERLDRVFPYSEYFFFSPSHLCDELNKLIDAETCEPSARIVLVPKDSRGPRIISCEPREFQYIQQGLMKNLVSTMEHHRLTKGFVNFSNQMVNRDLAALGSLDGSLATIDMKEASDRVSLNLVEKIFPKNWVKALKASRSNSTILPSGRVMKLKKFAPMGSACTFPVEALIFFSLLRANLPCNVWVYGDDIILPREYANNAISILEDHQLMVNKDKTLTTGFFRESCGGDFFHGVDIGYIKLKKSIAYHNIVSLVDFSNNIRKSWGDKIGRSILSLIETECRTIIPRIYSREDSIPLCYIITEGESNLCLFKRRRNESLQRFEYRVPILQVITRSCRKDLAFHWCELMRKSLTKDGISQVGHYAGSVPAIKYGWRSYRTVA